MQGSSKGQLMENSSKKILILFAAVGLGQKSIAENFAYHLAKAGYEIILMDVQKTKGGILVSWGRVVYYWVLKFFPSLWDFFYNTEWFINLTLPWRVKLAAFNSKHLLNEIIALQPDMVISTHNTASAMMSYLKAEGLYKGVFTIAFSDFHLHRYWLFKNADTYLANTNEQKEEMMTLGTYRNKIFVCGMSVKPKEEVDLERARNKYGIEPGEKVILIAGGSQGFGIDENLIFSLASKKQTKVVVLCGSNKKAFEYLGERFQGTNVIVLSYQEQMSELYAIADIFISKTGGLSISEALNWRLPIVVSYVLPGQEIHNYQFLLEKGFIMPEPINLVESVFEELDRASFRESILKNKQIDNLLGNGAELVEAVNQSLK